MPVPSNALPGDFFLVSFDGANPNIPSLDHWFKNGGLIRLAQLANGEGFGQYEHAGIFVGNGKIIEAQSSGVAVANANRYDAIDTMWSSGLIALSGKQRTAICAAAYKYVGTPYSWEDYAALAAYRLKLNPATKNLKDYVANSKHMICSQLVDQCYEDAGIHLFNDGRWPGYVTPGSLWNLLKSKSK